MKNVFILTAIACFVTGCGAIKPTALSASPVHQETIGAVHITFDETGNWLKLVSTGIAPMHNKSALSVSEAAKIASMRAKQNIAEFMNNNIRSDKTVEVVTKSNSHTASGSEQNTHEDNGAEDSISADGKANTEKRNDEIRTLTTVIERIRDDSSAILRGIQTTNQVVTDDQVLVEVCVSKQSIAASQNLRAVMSGNAK